MIMAMFMIPFFIFKSWINAVSFEIYLFVQLSSILHFFPLSFELHQFLVILSHSPFLKTMFKPNQILFVLLDQTFFQVFVIFFPFSGISLKI